MFQMFLSLFRYENMWAWTVKGFFENPHTEQQGNQMVQDVMYVYIIQMIVDGVKVVVVCVLIVAVIYRKTSTVTKDEDIKSNKTWNFVVILGTGLYMLYSQK